jgi:predicted Zn-dependent protease
MYESARRYFAMALDRQPHNWALMHEIAARLHLPAGEPAEALDMATLGLTLNPVSPDLWRTVAEAHLALHRPDAARQAADRAVTLAPSNVAAQQVLAQVALAQGDVAAALHAIAEALARDAEGDMTDALLAVQGQVLADIARRQIRVLSAQVNPFRAQDSLPRPADA